MNEEPTPKAVAIVGPTGAGKSRLALALAQRIGAEIVNCDSRQVYRGLDVGSAKPGAAERERVAHHLFDVADPDESFDCARYRTLALAAIADIERRGRRVLLVGGTGLYLKALQYGVFAGPPRDAVLRRELEAMEDALPGALHEELARVDPEAARRLHPHDRVRLIRALEVARLTGRTISAWQREHGFRKAVVEIDLLGLNLERAVLYRRIEERCRSMIEAGLIEEVRGLWARGYAAELGPLQSIGYREIGAYLRGECTLEAAIADMARATRRLAKRQLTWFRAVAGIRWFDADRASVAELEAVLAR